MRSFSRPPSFANQRCSTTPCIAGPWTRQRSPICCWSSKKRRGFSIVPVPRRKHSWSHCCSTDGKTAGRRRSLIMAQAPAKSDYQGRIHNLQKDMIGRYYARLTAASEGKGDKAIYMLISGNPVELIEAFDMLPVYPEVNALQLAVKKQSLPLILAAEEMGYSTDNCAYVKADVGMYFAGRKTPFATIPEPDLILCNYVGCNV